MPNHRIVTRAIILNNEGKVLLGKRSGGSSAGQWALIGGKPEGNETAESAITREVNEELGLIFFPTFWMDEVDTTSVPGEEWRVSYFYGRTQGGIALNPEEITEIIFVSEEDLDNLQLAYDHKEILRNFFQSAIR